MKPTVKQLTALVSLGVNPSEAMSRGDAANMIGRLSGRKVK